MSYNYSPSLGAYAALGDELGPDALAQAAQAILNALPAGSGQNPITLDMQRAGTASVPVQDPDGGVRWVDYYTAHPILDASGLIEWTGYDTGNPAAGLTAAQRLAAQVLLAGGSTSWSADFHPVNTLQYAAPQNSTPTAPETYDPGWTAPTPITPAQAAQINTAIATASGDPTANTGGDVQVTDSMAYTAIDAITAAGGDPTAPTLIIDQSSGAPVGVVHQLPSGNILVASATTATDLGGTVQAVTGFIDHLAGQITNVGTELQHVGNGITGAAAGAQAGYNAPLNLSPWLLGGAAIAAVLLVSRR